jgi:hypothetical protein
MEYHENMTVDEMAKAYMEDRIEKMKQADAAKATVAKEETDKATLQKELDGVKAEITKHMGRY